MGSDSSETSDGPWEDVQAIARRFARAWLSGRRRPSLHDFLEKARGHPQYAKLAFLLARTDLNQRLLAGDDPPLQEVLGLLERKDACLDGALRLRLIRLEYDRRWWRGEPGVSRAEYLQRFPEYREAIAAWTPLFTCPRCNREDIPVPEELLPVMEENPLDQGASTVSCPSCKSAHSVAELFRVPVEQGFDRRDYTLGKRLGVGGMGEVYQSQDPALKRELAIKVIKQEYRNRVGEWRFAQEAKITSRLEHPHIVPVYNFGRLQDGRLFYTMQLVLGPTLEDKLKRLGPKAKERLNACLDDFERICQALAHAHEQGVIHRDLKPGNIKVGDVSGKVQVLDWGLVKRILSNGEHACEQQKSW